ncbi:MULTISPECIES: hypothetical protein [unclassified Fusibacter]|nr:MULTISPECIES: hypothetical protein [unclassified Fusibacter]
MFHFSSLTKAERFAMIDRHILHHKETIEILRGIEEQKERT